MTTIAWDGVTLAADTQVTNNNVRGLYHKIHALPSGDVVAGCGLTAEVLEGVDWLIAGEEGEPPELCESTLIRLNADGRCWIYIGKMKKIPAQSVDAWGSGGDFALAALTLGKTAKEAVIFASDFCVYTNNKVDTVTFKPVKGKPARKTAKKK